MNKVLFNIHDVVLLITAYLCLLFALLCLTQKEKFHSNILLAAFLICHAAIPFDLLIMFGDAVHPIAVQQTPGLFQVFVLGYWLEAPILLMYVRSLLYKNNPFNLAHLSLLAPAVLYILYSAITRLIVIDPLSALHTDNSPFDMAISERAIIYLRESMRLAFYVACVWEVIQYRRQIRHKFSDIEKIDYAWLSTLTMGFSILQLWQVLVVTGLELSVGFNLNIAFETMGILGNYATLGMVSLLIFFSLSHSSIFDGIEKDEQGKTNVQKTPEIDARDVQRLEQLMASEKPYLNNNLNVNELAKLAHFPPRNLSIIINRHFGKNFFEFINLYRIEEAKELLRQEDKRNLTVLDIMYESGFNSKATFNTFFKKQTGKTPSQYRKERLATN